MFIKPPIKICWLIFFFILVSCSYEEDSEIVPVSAKNNLVSAVDISRFPEINETNPEFYNADGQATGMLQILKNSGVNTIRLRLWVQPLDVHSGFQEVLDFSQELKTMGFKLWITAHYSDTWTDPGHQNPPERWMDLSFVDLQDSVEIYTHHVITRIQPDYFQIGNEINPGFLHPYGNRYLNPMQFTTLLTGAAKVIRSNSVDTKIILHYAGLDGIESFMQVVQEIDYDIIGVSFYPVWHGKDMNDLQNTLQGLSRAYQKEILIAETAYPFTLDWNDWTNNIVGLQDQLILPQFPASPQGQKDFVERIAEIIFEDIEAGVGFCYWGAELIAWKGPQATDASPWENQALFDFNNNALPVLNSFEIQYFLSD